MKKTVTTMLSLALAMILVSSLSSGVILAKGRDAEVVIFDCGLDEFAQTGFLVIALHIMIEADDFGIIPADMGAATTCVDAIAVMLKAHFKMESSGSGFNPGIIEPNTVGLYSRYTFVRTKRGPRNNEE